MSETFLVTSNKSTDESELDLLKFFNVSAGDILKLPNDLLSYTIQQSKNRDIAKITPAQLIFEMIQKEVISIDVVLYHFSLHVINDFAEAINKIQGDENV